jgi:hypothetical protein
MEGGTEWVVRKKIWLILKFHWLSVRSFRGFGSSVGEHERDQKVPVDSSGLKVSVVAYFERRHRINLVPEVEIAFVRTIELQGS